MPTTSRAPRNGGHFYSQTGRVRPRLKGAWRKALEFADIGYALVGGRVVKAGRGKELLTDPDMGRLFLGG